MAQIGITLAPTLTVGLTLSSGSAVVTLDGAVPNGLLHTLSLAPAGPVVLATAGEILRGERGLRGEQGIPGVAVSSPDLRYTHMQSSAADVWTVAHNLGKYPSATVLDSAGDQVEGALAYLDTNNLTISFSAAFGGVAYLN